MERISRNASMAGRLPFRLPDGATSHVYHAILPDRIGGMNGFYVIKPQQEINRIVPKLVIASVHSAHESHRYNLPPEKIPALHLMAGDYPFRIDLLGMHFLEPAKSQYAYYLQGQDKSWHGMGQNREITISRLPPGYYRLLVRTANNDGI